MYTKDITKNRKNWFQGTLKHNRDDGRVLNIYIFF